MVPRIRPTDSITVRTAGPLPPRRSCTTTVASGACSASSVPTSPCAWPVTTIRRAGESSRAVARTWPSMVLPQTLCRTFGVRVFIRVPSPAARMMTAAGPLALTRLLGIGAGTRREAAPPGHVPDSRRIPPDRSRLRDADEGLDYRHPQRLPGVQIANRISKRHSTWNVGVLLVLKGEDAVTINDSLRVLSASESPASVIAFPYLHSQKLKSHELTLFQSDTSRCGSPSSTWPTRRRAMCPMAPGFLWRV